MKIINDDMQIGKIGNFSFSGVRPDKLGATEYTLVTIVTDKTGSVEGFAPELLQTVQAVIQACKKSPRANFLMLRMVEFNESIDEINGFAELGMIDPAQYTIPVCSGMTALYDATFNAVAATNEYARTLSANDFGVNGIVFVITDGDDNRSARTPSMVGEEIKRGVQSEWIESMNTVLIGVNASRYASTLNDFKTVAGMTQYVDVGDATPDKLAKLADFVSRSISSQSQSLGTGGASQALVF